MVISILQAFGVDLPTQAVGGLTAGLALVFGYLVRFLPRPPADAAGALLPLLVALPLLGACTPTQNLAVDAALATGVESIRAYEDKKAAVLVASVCAMSIGAYHRNFNDTQRQAIDTICGGSWQRPVTADDVKTLTTIYDLLKPQLKPAAPPP